MLIKQAKIRQEETKKRESRRNKTTRSASQISLLLLNYSSQLAEQSHNFNDQTITSLQNCLFWAEWSAFDFCTATCGGGTWSRRRRCINGPPGEGNCDGLESETVSCNTEVKAD